MATEVWVATAPIYLNNVRAYNLSNIVPDSVVTQFGLEAENLVERRTASDTGVPSHGVDPATQLELDNAIGSRAAVSEVFAGDGKFRVDKLPASVPRTVNGKAPAANGDVVLSPSDVGALPSATKATDIGGLDQAAGDGRYPRKGDLGVNVRDYGAKGDGITNDAASIQAALNVASGQQVFVPAGTYLAAQLTVPAGTELALARSATLKLSPGTNREIVTLNGTGATLRGGTLDGNALNQTTSNGGFSLVKVMADDCAVEGVTVTNAAEYGIRMFRNRGRVRYCLITDTGDNAIFVQPASSSISGTEIIGNVVDRTSSGAAIVEGGIKVHRNGTTLFATQTRIIGNQVTLPPSPTAAPAICIEVHNNSDYATVAGNLTSGGYMGISIAGAKGVEVTGNTIFNPKTYGVELAASLHCTVTGNSIDGNALADNGINCNTTASYNSITGNTIRRCVGSSIKAQQASNYLSVAANTLLASAAYAVEFSACQHLTITGNTMDGSTTALKGVMLDNSDRAVISGNVIRQFAQNGVMLYAVTAVTLDHVTVTGNVFEATGGALTTSLSGGATIGGNVRQFSNTGAQEVVNFLSNVRIVSGTGSPEGVAPCGVGSMYLRSNGAGGTTLYVKESGTGNTGWVSAGVTTRVTTQTASYTVTVADGIVIGNGASITLTLPSATTAGAGRRYVVKNINATTLTIGSAAGTIDGTTTASLAQWANSEYVSDGANWLSI